MIEAYPWRYRCGICQKVLHPNEVQAHLEEERARPDWPGYMRLMRVDVEGEPINDKN